jgi:hypothetical protein
MPEATWMLFSAPRLQKEPETQSTLAPKNSSLDTPSCDHQVIAGTIPNNTTRKSYVKCYVKKTGPSLIRLNLFRAKRLDIYGKFSAAWRYGRHFFVRSSGQRGPPVPRSAVLLRQTAPTYRNAIPSFQFCNLKSQIHEADTPTNPSPPAFALVAPGFSLALVLKNCSGGFIPPFGP